jgi:hypothetical protein
MKNFLLVILFIFTQFLFSQTTNNWPKPSVTLYDCNSSAVTTDSTSQNILNTSSRLILQDILSDTTTKEVNLFSFGYADTTATDPTTQGLSFTLPDSGGAIDADYLITSNITGNAGSYILTVSIEDGHTYIHVVDGTSAFSSITDNNVKSACLTAVQKILPLAINIRNYQESLKNANPLLWINPQIVLSPAKSTIPLKGSTNVTITITDCDGTPMANRQLYLEATHGSFGVSTAQTDNTGQVTEIFTAGGTNGIAIITATLQNSLSVTHDTTSPFGSEAIVVGNIDTSKLWVMNFNFSRSGTGYKDELLQEPGGTGWQQRTSFFTQSAKGKFFGYSNGSKNNAFNFLDTSLSVSGTNLIHNFSKYSGPVPSGETCPKNYWEMTGSTWSYIAKKNSDQQGSADFEYQPTNGWESFDIVIPYTMVDGYAYDWKLYGIWDNGKCETHSTFDDGHASSKVNTFSSIILAGTFGQVKGLSIMPFYSGSTIIYYTITVNNTITGIGSDGSYYVNMDQCTAILKPFSTVTGVEETKPLLNQFFLSQNYPNPFNPTTVINYQLPAISQVTLKVYDVLGREVRILVSERESAGNHSAVFDAKNLPSGTYFYTITAGQYTQARKMMLIK